MEHGPVFPSFNGVLEKGSSAGRQLKSLRVVNKLLKLQVGNGVAAFLAHLREEIIGNISSSEIWHSAVPQANIVKS